MARPRGVRPPELLAALALAAWAALAPAVAEEKALVLGFSELAASDQSLGSLPTAIASQLLRRSSFARERYASSEETRSGEARATSERLESLRKAVSSARSARDLKALSVRSPARRASELRSAEEAVAKARAALEAALAEERGKAAMATGQPAALGASGPAPVALWKGHDEGRLLPVALDPAGLCEKEGVDLLVRGRVSSSGGLYTVELSLYVAALRRDAWSDTDYASRDGIPELVEALAAPLASGVLGKPYARVSFNVTPVDADFYLDGARVRDGSRLYLAPATVKAEARARGYEPDSLELAVEPGRDERIDLALTPQEAPSFGVESEPTGAAVYLDGHRLGYAPLTVPGAAYPRVIRIAMEGYEPAQVVADPDSPVDDIKVTLAPSDGTSFDERYDVKKSAFYNALGWFIVALPVPVLSGGLFQTYYQTLLSKESSFSTLSDDERKQLAVVEGKFNAYQTIFWVSSAATVGCLVNAAFRLADYLRTAQ